MEGGRETMESFGVQFRINDDRRFDELRAVYGEVKRDKDAGKFRDPQAWVALVPDIAKGNFEWPTADERARWLDVRESAPIAVSRADQQLGARWDFYRVFESFEEGDYAVLGCERVGEKMGELRINPYGYPYGGVGPLIALAEAFGFEILGVNECGRFESRSELLDEARDNLTRQWSKDLGWLSWIRKRLRRDHGR
jgi:hypothetical protein